MNLALVVGTRPEMIKTAPLIRACLTMNVPFFLVHTGQHYDTLLDATIFADLDLPAPRHRLHIGGQPYHLQMSTMVRELSRIFAEEQATVVIVQGDTNSVLAAALAANHIGIPVAHHEAGLRSRDLRMPEEVNRILTDQISTHLFVPTEGARQHLIEEGHPESEIVLAGNTIVDAVQQHVTLAREKSDILSRLGVQAHGFLLATLHRAENVDAVDRLQSLFDGLAQTAAAINLPILLPLHPRTAKKIADAHLSIPPSIRLMEPLGYLDFLQLESNARLILTDSGGIQEEACILRVPCVTLRDNTERPETLDVGSNLLAGSTPSEIVRASMQILQAPTTWRNPFGDGTAGQRIIETLAQRYRET